MKLLLLTGERRKYNRSKAHCREKIKYEEKLLLNDAVLRLTHDHIRSGGLPLLCYLV